MEASTAIFQTSVTSAYWWEWWFVFYVNLAFHLRWHKLSPKVKYRPFKVEDRSFVKVVITLCQVSKLNYGNMPAIDEFSHHLRHIKIYCVYTGRGGKKIVRWKGMKIVYYLHSDPISLTKQISFTLFTWSLLC